MTLAGASSSCQYNSHIILVKLFLGDFQRMCVHTDASALGMGADRAQDGGVERVNGGRKCVVALVVVPHHQVRAVVLDH